MATQDLCGCPILTGRNAAPSHYLFKIESFPLLIQSLVEKYITDNFEAGGFKWKMHIYLNGDTLMKVTDHISIYLELAETAGSLPTGWEVNAIINFFIYNQIEDKYFGLQDGRVKRFHAMNRRWGVAKFIDLKTFKNPLNGYVVDDSCVFGAEVYIVKNTFKGERLSMMTDPPIYKYTWKVKNFSALASKTYESASFGCYNWKVSLYPNGDAEGKGNCISAYLELSHSIFPPNTKLFTKYILCVKDQKNGKDIEFEADRLYTPASPCWGFRQMLTLAKLMDSKQGYLVDDTCIIEAQVKLLGLVLPES
ncbi:Ubiquitin carboxyl-terminal hydrolase [Melia azedarach]|uniref:Ubiquitin carboxyl-terminal hydrolase n=1 Tax=Melia azedarach TaxID=155640 RepID=A0ACC1YSD6_MELAZ|nr:Ubiquitin carboxyl-terminal hydrolase [Melia azedarach]